MFCHGANVCHRKPHVLQYTIANQQHARNQVLLRGSCGKVAGTQVLVGVLFPKFRTRVLDKALDLMVFQWFSWSSNGSHGLSKHECCRSTQRPWPSQVSLLMYSCHMPLYGTECLVKYGTVWRHGSSPTKLSCGGVAGTLREQGIWPPVHGFSKLVYWGFAARPFGRQARDRRQFKNHGFSVAGTNFLCETMCFSVAGAKRASGNSSKNMVFSVAGRNGCFEIDEGYYISCKTKLRGAVHFLL